MAKATKESIDTQIAKLEDKKLKIHFEEEKETLTNVACGKCGNLLDINPEDFMQKGVKAKVIVCSNCEMQNRVQVAYDIPPEEFGMATITKSLKEFAWETQAPSKFDDDTTRKWIKNEADRIKENKSRFPRREEQIMILALNLALNGEEKSEIEKD